MTKMSACYPNYELSISQGFIAAPIVSQQHQTQHQHRQLPQVLKKTQEHPHQQMQQQKSPYISSAAGGLAVATVTEAAASVSNLIATAKNYINTPKNYFVPLHVDCSVEYELPKQPKPAAGQRVEPLLMIHPCYFRKMESQRRSPFINNMPNTSRNGPATFVGVALVSQGSNIALASASSMPLKKTSVRNHQHHYNTRLNVSSQYGPISNTEQQHQLKQYHTKQQHKPQPNLSLMPQLARYPEGSAKFLEHSLTPIRRTAIAIVNRTNHHHILCSTQQTKNQSNQQQDHLVQNSSSPSKSTTAQWDQLTAVKSSIADQNPNKLPSAHCESGECSIIANSTLGKRDAMISGSGGYSNNLASACNNTSLRNQMNKSGCKNNTSSGKNNNTIVTNRSSYGISTCLVDSSKLQWNPKTNTTPALFMIDQSPIATVPSNFQAGPDTAPTTSPVHNKYRIIIDSNNESINQNNILTSSEKFRHYLRSHRVHPYLTGTSSHSDSTALSSKSVMAARGDFQILPQFSAAKSVVGAVSTATSFQQQMQEISCYNV